MSKMDLSDDEENQQFLEWIREAAIERPAEERSETRMEKRLDTSLNLPCFNGGTAAEAGILDMAAHGNAPLPIARGIAGKLERWEISRSLQPDFKKTVRLCCVFRSVALFVTRKDKVFALGSDPYGCLGIGNRLACSSPVEVEALSGKGVQTFAYGEEHVLALTGDGKVYGWGDNYFFQVGKAAPEKINSPTLVFEDAPVVEIACGRYHSACRTRKGDVYCWGSNSYGQIGIGGIKKKLEPQKVQGLIANLVCTGISCPYRGTIAIFENGEVYAWGWNGDGVLGMGSDIKEQKVPAKIDFKNIRILKVACGTHHSLAVTDEGSLYVWGDNSCGQLGWKPTKTEQDQPTPTRHPAFKETRIVEIAVSKYTSAVMTDKSEVLMWDDEKGPEVVAHPATVQDAFATLPFSETPVPLIVESRPSDSPITALPGWIVRFAGINVEAVPQTNASLGFLKIYAGDSSVGATNETRNYPGTSTGAGIRVSGPIAPPVDENLRD